MATDVNLGMLSLEELRRLLGQTQAATPYSQVGVSPYQQIMGRMPLLQNPYAGVSGGYNNFQGGYNPNMYSNAPRAIGQLGFGGGGGSGGGGVDAVPSGWDNMTNAEKAAYYAENPNMAAITQFGQKAFGFTTPGMLQAMMNPGFVSEQALIAMGVNPAAYQSAKESFRASEIADMNAAAEAAQTEAGRQAAQESFRSSEITQQNQDSTPSGGGEQTGPSGSTSGAPGGTGDSNTGQGGQGTGSECVDPATLILMADGTEAAASSLRIGDVVHTMHEQSKEFGNFEVVHASVVQQPKAQLVFDNVHVIKTSLSHKFFTTDNVWKRVDALVIGDKIQTIAGASAEGFKTLTAKEKIGVGDVVKFTIKDAHTYISEGLISHNKDMAKGGLITNVFGSDPAGPDEGQVNIMRGEYVIKKSAVNKYGTGLLDMINNGKIPAKKMKSLLG